MLALIGIMLLVRFLENIFILADLTLVFQYLTISVLLFHGRPAHRYSIRVLISFLLQNTVITGEAGFHFLGCEKHIHGGLYFHGVCALGTVVRAIVPRFKVALSLLLYVLGWGDIVSYCLLEIELPFLVILFLIL